MIHLLVPFLTLLAVLANESNAFSVAPTIASPTNANAHHCNDDIFDGFDRDRIRRGQRFFQENCVAISMSWYCSLIASFSTPEPAEALLETGESDTGERAERRYMQRTIPALLSWHSEDFVAGGRGQKFLAMVNGKHRKVAANVVSSSSKCPFHHVTSGFIKKNRQQSEGEQLVGGIHGAFSHEHMAATQMAFVAGAVSCSKAFGMSSLKGLEDFVYLWFVLGKVLGIKDQHNSCTSLEKAQAAAEELKATFSTNLSESLRSKDQRFHKLTTAFLEGTNQHLLVDVSAPVAMQLTIDSLGLKLEEDVQLANLTHNDQITYKSFRWAMAVIGRLPIHVRLGFHKLQKKFFLQS